MNFTTIFPKFSSPSGTAFENQRSVGIEVAKVIYVDYELVLVDVLILNQNSTIRGISNFLSSDSSDSSEAGTLPSQGSFVLVGLISKAGSAQEWAVLGTLKSGYRSGQALIATRDAPEDPHENLLHRQISRKITESEFQISAGAGGEALFDEGWGFLSKDISEVKTDSITETVASNLHNVYTQSFNGRVQQGAAVRMLPDTSGLYAHPTGLSFQYVTPDGADPALRYKSAETPGLIVTEEVHVFHDTTDLIPDLTPHLHGVMPIHTADVNAISSISKKSAPWSQVSSDRPPDTQEITHPLEDNPDRVDPNQKLYTSDLLSIQHRRDLRYTHDSNLVGVFESDKSRYLSVLVPHVASKFSTDFNHTQIPLYDPHPHPEFRLRVPVRAEYSPLLHNQTAYYQTKEGYQIWVMGATLQHERNPLTGATTFDKGAGRSAEIFTLGGIEATLGKTRDEGESLSLTTIGQIFAHIGADSGKRPHERRSLEALDRVTGQKISLDAYNFDSIPGPGDSKTYQTKTASENLSMVLTMDGGVSARFGARNKAVQRKFVRNGTSDAPGRTIGGKDVHDAKREVYGGVNDPYQFHDLTQTAVENCSVDPCELGATSLEGFDADVHGRSWDFHLCNDWFMRVGKNSDSGTSWTMDTDGGLVWWLGKDDSGRSLTIQTDGGAQIRLKADSESGEALNLYITGNVNEYIEGSVTRVIEGDLHEHIKGSRTVEIDVNDTLMVAGNYTPIFKDYTLLCSGSGVMGFGLGLDFTVTGASKFDYQGALVTNVLGASKTTVSGAATETYLAAKTTSINGISTTSVKGLATETYKGGLTTSITGPWNVSATSTGTLKTSGLFILQGSAMTIGGAGPVTIKSPLSLG